MNQNQQNQQKVIQKYQNLGYPKEVILEAYNICDGQDNQEFMIDIMNNKLGQNISKQNQSTNQDGDMQKAILESIRVQENQSINNQYNMREDGVPIGLQNVGNTCYFNSLIQFYFQNFQFVRDVLNFQEKNIKSESQSLKKSVNLIKNLRTLFGKMIFLNKKFVDPSLVINAISDDFGRYIQTGEQKDIGEFNLLFLARIQEGFDSLKQNNNQQDLINFDTEVNSMNISLQNIDDDFDNKNMSFTQNQSIKNSLIRIQNDGSIIQQLFFGKFKISLQHQNDNEPQQQKEELFNSISLDIQDFNDIYSSWNNFCFQNIEGYKNEKVLNIISRVNKQKLSKLQAQEELHKIYHLFYKEKYFVNKQVNFQNQKKYSNLKKYLEKNINSHTKILKQIDEKIQQKKLLQEKLKQFQNYNQSNLSLFDIINETKSFLKEQQVDNKNDFNFIKSFPNSQIKQQQSALDTYQTLILQKQKDIQTQIDQIDQHIEQIYKPYNLTKYVLKTIMIHQGNHEFGHYYSYNYDFNLKCWWKCDDINVKQEDEENVFKEAYGGYNKCSAYCIIYVNNDQIYQESTIQPLIDYNIDSNDQYNKLLNKQSDLKNQLIQENTIHWDQYQTKKLEQTAQQIIDLYCKKYEKNNELFRILKQQNENVSNIPLLVSFGIYLKNQKGYQSASTLDQYLRYFLLNSSIRDIFSETQCQQKLKQSQPTLYQKIQQKSTEFSEFNCPIFDLKNLNDYDNYQQNYLLLLQGSHMCEFLLNSAIKAQYQDALFQAQQIIDLLNQQKDIYFYRLTKDLGNILILKLISDLYDRTVKLDIHQNNINQVYDLIKQKLDLVFTYYTVNKEQTESISKQLQVYLSEIQQIIYQKSDSLELYRFIQERNQAFVSKKLNQFYQKEIEPTNQEFGNMIINFIETNDIFKLPTKIQNDNRQVLIKNLMNQFQNDNKAICQLYQDNIKNNQLYAQDRINKFKIP